MLRSLTGSLLALSIATFLAAPAAAEEQHFKAERGQGATLNGKPIHVAAITDLRASMVGCDIGYVQELSRRMLNAAVQVQPQVRRLRILGSAVLAMAYVACGRLDAFCRAWYISAI